MLSSVAPLRTARLAVVLAGLLALMSVAALPAAATEAASEGGAAPTEDAEHLTVEDIGSGSDTAEEYKPEPTEAPPFMRFFYIPLIIAGFLIVGALLMLYLAYQPRFAEESRSKRRR
jgi:hypothetical protein